MTCSYIARREDGVVLIDTGMDSQARDVEVGLAAANGDWSDISAIVLTHWHNDHAAGAMETQRRSAAPVFCGRDEVPYVQRATRRAGPLGALGDRWPERGPLVLAKGLLTNAPKNAVARPVVAADGTVVAGLQIIETPGHTPGHLSVWDPVDRVVFTGDALAIVGGEVRHMAKPVTPDVPRARASMLRVLDLKPSLICPGHRAPLRVTAEDLSAARQRTLDSRWPLLG